MAALTDEEQRRNWETRLSFLERQLAKNGRYKLPTRLQLTGSGTSAERDTYFGVPTTDAQRVLLANAKVTWFNTDLGWDESFYAIHGTAGLTATGLMTGGPAAGWYPVSKGPRAKAMSAGAQAFTTTTQFTNWRPSNPAPTGVTDQAGNASYAEGMLGVSASIAHLEIPIWGRYDAFLTMGVPGGSGIGVLALSSYRPSAGTYPLDVQKPAQLLSGYGNYFEFFIQDHLFMPGDRVHARSVSGTWSLGQGNSHMTVRYVGPPLVSRILV